MNQVKHGWRVLRNMESEDKIWDIRSVEQAQRSKGLLAGTTRRLLRSWLVWLRLRHREPASLPQVTKGKLKPRFFGPYQVNELINNLAVRLALPPRTRLHDVFHVSLLKKFVGMPPDARPPLLAIHNGAAIPEPERATRMRLARGVRQVLIEWKGEPATSATWEDVDTFMDRYPAF